MAELASELTEAQRAERQENARKAIATALRDTWTHWRRLGRTPDFDLAADLAIGALADLAVEILVDGTLFKGLNVRDGQMVLELEPARDILLLMVGAMRGLLDGHGAENYLETEILTDAPKLAIDLQDGQHPGDSYTVTIQRRYRPTPHEFRRRAEARVEHALTECDAIIAEVHGQHDEDDDGMREAVRRIRAALTGQAGGS